MNDLILILEDVDSIKMYQAAEDELYYAEVYPVHGDFFSIDGCVAIEELLGEVVEKLRGVTYRR